MTCSTTKPLVSIITPSFNQGRWLGDNLKSVAAQTYPRIEHIVSDGGSEDDSVAVLEKSEAVWRSGRDDGQSQAINDAFRRSSGEIIGWLNSDDAYWDDEVVSAVVDAFLKDDDVDVIYGHAALVDAAGGVLQMIWVPPFSKRVLRHHNYIIQPAVFLRRRVVESELVDDRYASAMDRELWLRLSNTARFKRIPRVLAIDRHHPLRKSYVAPQLARADGALLAVEHDVAFGTLSRIFLKILKIIFRVVGLSLVHTARRPTAFSRPAARAGNLLARQILVPRRRMRVTP